MPQFNAILRNLPLSPDVTATETACMLKTLYCLTISMHVAFSVCLLLYSVCPYWANQFSKDRELGRKLFAL